MAQLSLRVEDDVKAAAERVCAEIGLSMSAAINIYLKKIGRERRIPFLLTCAPEAADEEAVLARRAADARAGKNMAAHELLEV